jgi:hypothetical protein
MVVTAAFEHDFRKAHRRWFPGVYPLKSAQLVSNEEGTEGLTGRRFDHNVRTALLVKSSGISDTTPKVYNHSQCRTDRSTLACRCEHVYD